MSALERVGDAGRVVGIETARRQPQGDPAHDTRVLALGHRIMAHWPGLPLSDDDLRALYEALRRARVTFDQAMAAVQQLAEEGREFPPRAPHLIAAVKRARAYEEGQTREVPEDRQLAAHATMRPEEVAAQAEALSPAVASLVARAMAAASRRDGTRRGA